MARLELSRAQILAFRRATNHLDERLPRGAKSLRKAGWAGLQDSMPRAALLSIHARVEGATPSSWEDPALVQLWGPRYSTYVVPKVDRALFSVGRLAGDARRRAIGEEMAAQLHALLKGGRMADRAAGAALGFHSNRFRYAGPTGTILIRWEGARAPLIWEVPAPKLSDEDAELELARRYLHVFGPTTPESFTEWAGVSVRRGPIAFGALGRELLEVGTTIGPAWVLAKDEALLAAGAAGAAKAKPPAPARLLPSGDAFFLLQGAQRDLLVPEADRRAKLWTTRVWPGALLVGREIAGTWRRANANLTIEPWRRLSAAEHEAVEAEALTLPLPGPGGPIRVRWLE
ncbi:MAG TPA: crosslink repair DNA glycosylase YcaQ family protein [Candidatus Limnocylindria bacterium]|nr:crosslink repair DNA glycosylase YcaQ family protein [Candidatus Limnocylindria bacterium]